jgi:hypothetical protein
VLLRGAPPPAAAGVRGIGEVEEVGALGLVEPECACEGFQHGLRNAGEVAVFEARVVVRADPGEQGDLVAAESGDAAVGAEERQTGLLGGDLGPSRGQEVAYVGPVIHGLYRRRPLGEEGGSTSTGHDRHW